MEALKQGRNVERIECQFVDLSLSRTKAASSKWN
jgi:hypothetical protein